MIASLFANSVVVFGTKPLRGVGVSEAPGLTRDAIGGRLEVGVA